MQPFDVPNLDGYSTEPNDLIEAAAVFSRLAAYADAKGRAMQLRMDGDVEAALSFERCADTHYRRLPPWARW